MSKICQIPPRIPLSGVVLHALDKDGICPGPEGAARVADHDVGVGRGEVVVAGTNLNRII